RGRGRGARVWPQHRGCVRQQIARAGALAPGSRRTGGVSVASHGSSMPSCPSHVSLHDFLGGRLADHELDGVARHVAQCTECQRTLGSLTVQDALLDTVHSLKGNIPLGQDDPEVHALVGRLCDLLEAAATPALTTTPAERKPDAVKADAALTERGSVAAEGAWPSIPGYDILGPLGVGGMGGVYKARHRRLGKLMALKLLPQGPMSAAVLDRLRQEMQAVGRLNHAHIVQAHDAGEVDGVPYLAMEYVEGVDLAKLVERHGPLGVADACEIMRQAAVGLQHAH